MATLHKYRIYCTTELDYVYEWKEEGATIPTSCPNDAGHSIDTSSTVITDTVSETGLVLKDKPASSMRYFDPVQLCCTIPSGDPGDITIYDWQWPFDIYILAATCFTAASNEGDGIQVLAAPDTTIGVITSDIVANDSIINVQQSVIDNIRRGYSVQITDGTNTENFICIAIDDVQDTITIGKILKNNESQPTIVNNYAAASPTYIKMSVPFSIVPDLSDPFVVLQGVAAYHIGDVAFGATLLPANTLFRIRYKNLNGSSKQLYTNLQIFW